jgi:hypothetical protein
MHNQLMIGDDWYPRDCSGGPVASTALSPAQPLGLPRRALRASPSLRQPAVSETRDASADDPAVPGLSLETAAGLAGISKSYLSMLENGERRFSQRGLLEDLAMALGCSVTDLTGQP